MSPAEEEVFNDLDGDRCEAERAAQDAVDALQSASTVETMVDYRANLDDALASIDEARTLLVLMIKHAKAVRS